LQTGAGVDPGNGSSDLQRFLARAAEIEGRQSLTLRRWLDLAETWRITQTLRDCGGNRSAAARRLGIGRRTLYAKMEKLGIRPTWEGPEPRGVLAADARLESR
jgi:DNA-binding NtrC family response regulator